MRVKEAVANCLSDIHSALPYDAPSRQTSLERERTYLLSLRAVSFVSIQG